MKNTIQLKDGSTIYGVDIEKDKVALEKMGVDVVALTKQKKIDALLAQQKAELDALPMSASLIKTLESSIGKARRRSAKVAWIVNRQPVQLTVTAAQTMADNASDAIEAIYFKYQPLIAAV